MTDGITLNVFGAIRKRFILALPNNIREPEESPYIFWRSQYKRLDLEKGLAFFTAFLNNI